MIAKCIKGKGFRGAVAYDLQKDKSILLETNMAAGEHGTVKAFTAEFAAIRALRPSLSKAVCHVSLSLHPDEKLDDNQWREVGHAWLEGMGFTDNQYIISRHTDTEHPNIHILVNRVGLDGRVVSDSNDYKRQETIMRRLEKEYGLIQVPNSTEIGRKSPTKGEVEHALRTRQPSVRMCLQNIIDNVLGEGSLNVEGFTEKLAEQNVEVKLNQASTGTVSGISFAMDGVAFKGSALGKGYTWKSLQKRGLIYENGRTNQFKQHKEFTNPEHTKPTERTRENTNHDPSGTDDGTIKMPHQLEQNHSRSQQGDKKHSPQRPQLSR